MNSGRYYNNRRRAPMDAKNKKSKKQIVINFAILIVSFIFLITGSGFLYVDHMLSQINFQQDPEPESSEFSFISPEDDTNTFEDISGGGNTVLTGPGAEGGLYHDDQIMNVLVVGVDNYQENDRGRTDSMIVVSIDTRHQKLKMTSVMRDMFVRIPGYSSNRINAAFSLGGSPLTVQTIENNFGVDIDRWVEVDFDAFAHIIDRIGGVTLTLTDAEANLVNQYSGESWDKHLPGGGTYRLTGRQARYYARIRAIGDDFERTERQRKVMISIIDEFKSSDLATINALLYDTLPEISTNLSKNEILSLAANSLTYMNYPIEQNRLPMDGAYNATKATIGGVPGNDVLVPDLQKNSQGFAEFIYEDDLPERK